MFDSVAQTRPKVRMRGSFVVSQKLGAKEGDRGILARGIGEKPGRVPESKRRAYFSVDRAFNGVNFHRREKEALGDCVESSVRRPWERKPDLRPGSRYYRVSELESGEVEIARVYCPLKMFC